jgi:hypothetical protein
MHTVSFAQESSLGKLLPSDASSEAFGINSLGTIVGVSENAGFLWDGVNGMQALTSLLDPKYFPLPGTMPHPTPAYQIYRRLSASDSVVTDACRGVAAGFDGYIVKPPTFPDLLAFLKRYRRQRIAGCRRSTFVLAQTGWLLER